MLEALLANGKSVALYPGGIHEQMATDSTCERLYFPPNLGFIRQAMTHGVPLVPVYNFGENQVVGVPDWSRKISEDIRKYTGAGVPVPSGRWGLPGVPNTTHVKTYMGREVDVGGVTPDPTDTQVRDVFLRYCAELHRLFNEHCESSLPAKVASKGLTIVWRGHESEDFGERSVQLALGEKRQSRSRL
jgi:2-acylglycerol O-acyltransferase 2